MQAARAPEVRQRSVRDGGLGAAPHEQRVNVLEVRKDRVCELRAVAHVEHAKAAQTRGGGAGGVGKEAQPARCHQADVAPPVGLPGNMTSVIVEKRWSSRQVEKGQFGCRAQCPSDAQLPEDTRYLQDTAPRCGSAGEEEGFIPCHPLRTWAAFTPDGWWHLAGVRMACSSLLRQALQRQG